ncbi:polynucleotide adenylyltransferase PcnB [Neisseria wadsworthii]|nr:polynucleotide adenylyltransferase PcnB [Neisseria wadsworthii]QMT35337.1 polynucleotide adenylyltransferase PcnB [Neisseria wadsworthii]
MLKKLWRKMVPAKSKMHKRVLPFAEHHINADKLNFAAEKVVDRLHHAGYEAYVVGGAVRDLLLGVEPKDFDVATNATPEQVRKVFRRSRIIGRRFQIVHVMVGPETIEVTTFRGGDNALQNEHGRIMKDNTYGSMEEDAMRRDFTCNALYFDPIRREIIDFHHGVEDVRNKKLVMIGEPEARYQEDPVRILRAIRLSGKLGFDIEEATAAPIAENAARLKNEPAARLFDEMLKILLSGYARRCLDALKRSDIDVSVHPILDALKQSDHRNGQNIITLALKNTDDRLRADKSVSVGFVLAAVLWPELYGYWQQHLSQGEKPVAALNSAIGVMRDNMEQGWGVPQRFSATMREIWALQPQFDFVRGNRPFRLLAQPRFRAAYDFLVLRAQTGEVPQELVDWWTAFQHADEHTKQEMTSAKHAPATQSGETEPAKKKRRRPRKRKPKPVIVQI